MFRYGHQGLPKYSGWTEDTTVEAVRLYEQGLSPSEVADWIGRPQSTVWVVPQAEDRPETD